jgi:hypothetical protein
VRHLLLATALLSFAAAPAFANCGSEGCPLQPFGPERPHGRWTFDVGFQSVEQNKLWDGSAESEETEGVGHVTERLTDTEAWVGNVGFTISPRIQLQAVVPWMKRRHAHDLEHHAGTFVTYEWQYQGIGDASVLGNWHVTGDAAHGAGALTMQAGVKLPTGETEVEEIDGEAPEPPARLGTGSTDVLVGATFAHAFNVRIPGGRGSMPLGFSVQGRLNGRGTEDYQVGNSVMGNFAASYPMLSWGDVLFQVNGVIADRDDVGDTDGEPHETGSETLYLTPGARLHLPNGIGAYAYWQIRTYAHTNGPQLVAPSHILFGLSYALR